MANDINRVMLIGRMVRDPELRQTQNGTAYCRFSLAVNRSFTQNGEKREDVSFIDCVSWQRLAEIINQYARKGKQMCVEGRLNQRSWKDDQGNNRSSTDVVVENMQLLGSRGGGDDSDFGPSGASDSYSGTGSSYSQGYSRGPSQSGSYGQQPAQPAQQNNPAPGKQPTGPAPVYTDDFADDDIPF